MNFDVSDGLPPVVDPAENQVAWVRDYVAHISSGTGLIGGLLRVTREAFKEWDEANDAVDPLKVLLFGDQRIDAAGHALATLVMCYADLEDFPEPVEADPDE